MCRENSLLDANTGHTRTSGSPVAWANSQPAIDSTSATITFGRSAAASAANAARASASRSGRTRPMSARSTGSSGVSIGES